VRDERGEKQGKIGMDKDRREEEGRRQGRNRWRKRDGEKFRVGREEKRRWERGKRARLKRR